jgi:hypothetical protein
MEGIFDACPLSVVYTVGTLKIFLYFLYFLVKYVFENTGCSSIFAIHKPCKYSIAIFINVTIQ